MKSQGTADSASPHSGSSGLVQRLHARAVASQNPVYVWLALLVVLHEAGGQTEDLTNQENVAVPGWVAEYLLGRAELLQSLAVGIDFRIETSSEVAGGDAGLEPDMTLDEISASPQAKRSLAAKKIDPTKAMSLLSAVFGFTRQGWNAFEAYAENLQLMAGRQVYETNLMKGATRKEARLALQSLFGTEDDRAIRKRLAKARKIMEAGRAKPGG